MFFRLLLAILFIVAGALHFVVPQMYVKIMPPYIPAQLVLLYVSGVFEFFGGAGLLFRQPVRGFAAWGLVALLIAVMPANIYMATNHTTFSSIPAWALYLRLPLQLPLIWWAWLYTRP